jgi:Fic-DOC domain mobile mystery protein B
MLGEVWDWAGQYRRSDKNIGVPHRQIEMAMYELVDSLDAWTAYKSYEPDAIAIRFAHRLVQIHPFPNGNGRHSRLAADLLSISWDGRAFTWGRGGLISADRTRAAYIDALKAADRNEFGPLIAFARS